MGPRLIPLSNANSGTWGMYRSRRLKASVMRALTLQRADFRLLPGNRFRFSTESVDLATLSR
jgi:hypothetical protein